MMLHAEKIDDKGENKTHRKMGRKMVPKQKGRFLGNSLTVKKGITIFKFFIWGGISSDIRSEIAF